jgi:hypothetical protein
MPVLKFGRIEFGTLRNAKKSSCKCFEIFGHSGKRREYERIGREKKNIIEHWKI